MRNKRRWAPGVVLLWLASGGCGESTALRADADAETVADADAVAGADADAETVANAETVVDADAAVAALSLTAASPSIIDPMGGSLVVIEGSGFVSSVGVKIGGVAAEVVDVVSGTQLRVRSGAIAAGTGLDVVATRGEETATLDGAIEAWSPTEIEGAIVFDAASGIAGTEESSAYEWQRLSEEIHADWRSRDGNTMSYIPGTGKFWMHGGWNGYPEVPQPDCEGAACWTPGFGTDITTNEVWSSPDAIAWTLELPHGNDEFARRHVHNAIMFRDRLWLIGGDTWTNGEHNKDIVSTADGIHFDVEVEVAPWHYEANGTLEPTSGRCLQVAGVFDNKLWVVGGQNGLTSYSHGDLRATFHNDVWSSEDGANWTRVLEDTPDPVPAELATTRWSGRGLINQLVEFAVGGENRMWLIGGSRYPTYDATLGELVNQVDFAEVWSSVDGVAWRRHSDLPVAGSFRDVHVFDGKMWSFAGANAGGNNSYSHYSADGETWTQIEPGLDTYPMTHGQGMTTGPDPRYLYLAGGNYSFGGQYSHALDKSVWRLRAFHGVAVDGWTARGGTLVLGATGVARPLADPDAFGKGVPGVQFNSYSNYLALASPHAAAEGRSVFWVGRTPWNRKVVEDRNATRAFDTWPSDPVIGNTSAQTATVGLTEGQIQYSHAAGSWEAVRAGSGLMRNEGDTRFAGFTHDADGTLQPYVDGVAQGSSTVRAYDETQAAWDTMGTAYGRSSDAYFGGTLGAVVVIDRAVDAETAAKMYQWAKGRFGAL